MQGVVDERLCLCDVAARVDADQCFGSRKNPIQISFSIAPNDMKRVFLRISLLECGWIVRCCLIDDQPKGFGSMFSQRENPSKSGLRRQFNSHKPSRSVYQVIVDLSGIHWILKRFQREDPKTRTRMKLFLAPNSEEAHTDIHMQLAAMNLAKP